MVVANLCVAYIMIEKNHEAEELMKLLEQEEEAALARTPDTPVRSCSDAPARLCTISEQFSTSPVHRCEPAALTGYTGTAVQVLHSCIVNLVIGTLYCAKQNYEFGLSRVMKALEPLEGKLEADTWFYAKRCILALVDGLAKHMIFMQDKSFDDNVAFLERVAAAGADVPVSVTAMDRSSRCVSDEASLLRAALLDCRDAVAELAVA